MKPPRDLLRLLDVAAEGETTVLAERLTDILLAWPADFPSALRPMLEALLERVLRDADDWLVADICSRLAQDIDVPLRLLNACFLAAAPTLRAVILNRNEVAAWPQVEPLDEAALLAAVDGADGATISAVAGIGEEVAEAIAGDRTQSMLFVLAKGAGVGRAGCGDLAAVAKGSRSIRDRLAAFKAYDAIPPNGAANLVLYWRQKAGTQASYCKATRLGQPDDQPRGDEDQGTEQQSELEQKRQRFARRFGRRTLQNEVRIMGQNAPPSTAAAEDAR